MKKLILISALLIMGCQSSQTEIIRKGFYEGSASMRAEHLEWSRQLATTQPNLPHLTATDLRIREQWHEDFDKFNQTIEDGNVPFSRP